MLRVHRKPTMPIPTEHPPCEPVNPPQAPWPFPTHTAPEKPKRKRATYNVAKALVEKWAPLFGFGGYRWRVVPLKKQWWPTTWAMCAFLHDEEWFEIAIVPDGMISEDAMEHLICHELAHGLIDLGAGGGLAEEQAVCRIARLAGADVGPTEERRGAGKWQDGNDQENQQARRCRRPC